MPGKNARSGSISEFKPKARKGATPRHSSPSPDLQFSKF